MASKNNLIHEPNTTQIPNVILDFWIHELDPIEFKVLLLICRKTMGWHKKKDKISIPSISDSTGVSDRTIQRAINRLIGLKLVCRNFNKKQYGDYSPNTYSINVIELNKKTKIKGGGGDIRDTRGVVTPVSPTKPKVLFKSNISKGNTFNTSDSEPQNSDNEDLEGFALDLPFSIDEKEEQYDQSGRKYPRKPEQEKSFQWLKSLNLDTPEYTLSFWAHAYPMQKLQSAWAHLMYKISKGYKPRSLGAVFFKLVKTENSPITPNCLKNRQDAENFKKNKHWISLSLHERFCCEESRPDYDLPYCIDNKEFRERLISMWDLKNGKKYDAYSDQDEQDADY